MRKWSYSFLDSLKLCFHCQRSNNSRSIAWVPHSTTRRISATVGAAASEHQSRRTMLSDDRRPQFGGRTLQDPADVFKHNAWDDVAWDSVQEAAAQRTVSAQAAARADPEQAHRLIAAPDTYWDAFYAQHDNRFFKDRNWLFTEFPELAEECGPIDDELEHTSTQPSLEAGFPGCGGRRRRVWEVGCGVGNTIFPLLAANVDRRLFVYGSDFSQTAVDIVRASPQFQPERCHVFVLDAADESAVPPFPEGSIDVIVLIFVLSALHPKHQAAAVRRLARYLRPGGVILLRDYGRYDLAQLRFKPVRCLQENLYARGDGTLVYFFTQDELRQMFTSAGLEEVQNHVDRRLQVNRGKQIKMYRVWNQCKYRKPNHASVHRPSPQVTSEECQTEQSDECVVERSEARGATASEECRIGKSEDCCTVEGNDCLAEESEGCRKEGGKDLTAGLNSGGITMASSDCRLGKQDECSTALAGGCCTEVSEGRATGNNSCETSGSEGNRRERTGDNHTVVDDSTCGKSGSND